MVRILSDADVSAVLELEELLPVVETAFEKQYRGEVERPERPHYPLGTGLDADDPDTALGTGLCMPAYIHGNAYAATKLVAVHEANPNRGLPTVLAQIALTDAETGTPVGYMAGTRITNARTGCIGGLAARELAVDGPIDLGVIGAGTQARWQTRAIDAATNLASVRVYSPSDSSVACAADLADELDVPTESVSSPRDAVENASVVVTATTSTTPVFPGDALAPGTLVIAVGAYTETMRELDDETIDRANRVFADVPSEAVETGDLRPWPDLEPTPFGGLFAGEEGRTDDDEILVLESVGTAVLDAATAEHVHTRASETDGGTLVSL